jgi:hypothetical protein
MIDLILKFFGLQRIPKKSNKIVRPLIIRRKKSNHQSGINYNVEPGGNDMPYNMEPGDEYK